jgi:hypothetical protein
VAYSCGCYGSYGLRYTIGFIDVVVGAADYIFRFVYFC